MGPQSLSLLQRCKHLAYLLQLVSEKIIVFLIETFTNLSLINAIIKFLNEMELHDPLAPSSLVSNLKK